MSILWIYDKQIAPNSGGTERATHSVMRALAKNGQTTVGFLVFRQDHPRAIYDPQGRRIDDLYAFLKATHVHVVINQIGFSKWLLEEFHSRGGSRWQAEGGRVVTCMHFDPLMFSETLRELTRDWKKKTWLQKVRRLGRIAYLPVARRKAAQDLKHDYAYLIEKSDYYIILSEKHRKTLHEMSRTQYPERVLVIPNPNTFTDNYSKSRVVEKCKTVLIVSRLDEPQKRISLALLAWGQAMSSGNFDEWTLQVVGDGEYADDYRELIIEKRIRNVEFIGHTDPEKYYEKASIYLHTAKREGWGLTITEAMQKGVVPIVMNSCAVYEEFITDGQNGILSENGNIAAFAACIAELVCNQEKRQCMAERAIETTQQHDLDRIVRQWSDLVTVD